MRRRPFLLFLLAATAMLPAFAFERAFPENAKRGTMTPAPYPKIVIDRTTRMLTPGARIWNKQNLTQVPAELSGSEMPVNYTETDQGEIDRVWILRPEEANRPLKRR